MIHPDTYIKKINDIIGHGVFASKFIPKGTIVYIRDYLEHVISQAQYEKMSPPYQETVDQFSYINNQGCRIFSWDHGRYANHKCDCNVMSSAYGFEIALRDIEPGEEITDEYGIFNVIGEMKCYCGSKDCRGYLRFGDLDVYYKKWDEQIIEVLNHYEKVEQPLVPFAMSEYFDEFKSYLKGKTPYKSLITMKYPGAGKRSVD